MRNLGRWLSNVITNIIKPTNGPNQFTKFSSISSNLMSAMAVTPDTDLLHHNWYPDSGATNHCTLVAKNLANKEEYPGYQSKSTWETTKVWTSYKLETLFY